MEEKLNKLSIKSKLILMYGVGLVLALLMMLKIAFHWNEYRSHLEYSHQIEEQVEHMVLSLQTNYLIQKNEWKNMLLRGEDADKYLEHLNAFKAASEEIALDVEALESLELPSDDLRNYIDAFKTEEENIVARYIEALPVYRLAEHKPAQTVDKYLWNVTDKAFDLLQLIHVSVEAHLYEQKQIHNAELINTVLLILFIACITFLSLTYAFWITIKDSLIRPIDKLTESMEDIAQGERDLTIRLTVKRDDELGKLAVLYNQFMDKIQNLMIQVVENASNLTEASNRSQQITSATTETIRVQQNAIAKVASSMSQMAETVHVIADNASDAANNAHKTNEQAETGYAVTERAASSINQLSDEISSAENVIAALAQETKNIGSIVGAINEISDQTNLLALNAAIEAARAGDHGRGFAVVADEVRSLAAKTQGATEEVQSMIQAIQKEVDKAVAVMARSREQATESVHLSQEAGDALKMIMSMVSHIEQMNEEIADRSEQQSQVATNINQNVNEINESVEKTLNTAQQSISDNSDLAQLSMVLQSLIFQFRISEDQEQAGHAPASQKMVDDDNHQMPDMDDDGVELF
jgi:methyl-accepting chemotaxis protein